MNDLDLPYLGRDTQMEVKNLSDDWIVSGPIRAAVHLSGAWHRLHPKAFTYETKTSCRMNGHNVFAPVDPKHPWVEWAIQNDGNYSWLYFYAMDMCAEYERRHGMKPYITKMLEPLENMPDELPEGEWTEPLFAAGVR